MRINVYVDFDGTIAPDEPTDALFDRFADPSWREIEKEWQQGRMTSRDCMERQIALLRATPDEVDRFLADVTIDPDFTAFVRLCHRQDMRLVVVSDGLDRIVGTTLRGAGLSLPFYANELQWLGDDRWGLAFPHARRDCRVNMGNCKCSHRRAEPRAIDILVGDGRSDFCLAQRSDLVLAKNQLAVHCREAGVPHHRIRDFSDAIGLLASWCESRHQPSAATWPGHVGLPLAKESDGTLQPLTTSETYP